ncbi:Ypt6p [Saccharomyces cerevisiae VL3]|nr:Ypt6p [Saccharomyces cerevisiae VL3]
MKEVMKMLYCALLVTKVIYQMKGKSQPKRERKKAKLLGAKIFMETSTKAGYNVKALFKKIAKSLPEFQNSESTPLDSENANSANQNKPGVIDISTAEEQEQSACQC